MMDQDYGCYLQSPTTTMTTATPPLKRTRAKRSCDFCRQRKSKCDADTSTPCTNCKSWGYTCEFQTVRKKRGPPSVYVDNLEKRCKKMERLLTQLTNSTIKDLERTDFTATHQRSLSDPSVADSSSDDDSDQDDETTNNTNDEDSILERLAHLNVQDYDSLKYTGQSAGLLDPQALFKSKSYIAWPGRQDVVLQRMADDQLMVVRTEKSAVTGKVDTRLDVGISIHSGLDTVASPHRGQNRTLVKPSKPMINQMIQLYFTHLHTSLPVINKHRFLQLYNTHSSALPKVLLQAVLAVSFRFAAHHSLFSTLSSTTASEHSDHFFRKVMKQLRDPARSRLCHVQAGLLATLYLDMEEGTSDVESIQWHTLGKAIRMAQDLGLHRSCEHWQLPLSEIETRHRVFYACYALDRWIGARSGKPLTILDRDFDTTLPSMYEVSDNIDQTPNKPIYRAFVLWVKLAEVVGRVLKALYAPSAKKANSNANLDDPMILVVFDRRLKHWYGLMEESIDGMPLPHPQKVSLQIYYNTVILLLRRPFLSISKYLTLEHLVLESRQVSVKVASELTRLIQQSNQLGISNNPANWFASSYLLPTCYVYAMFLSSLAHLNIVLHHRSCPEKRAALFDSIQLIESHNHIPASRRVLEILNMLIALHDLLAIDVIKTEDALDPFYNPQAFYNTSPPTAIPSPCIFTPSTSSANEGEMPKTHWFQRHVNTSVVGGVPAEIQQAVQSDLHHYPYDTSYIYPVDAPISSDLMPFSYASSSAAPSNPSPSNLNFNDWQYYMTAHPPSHK